MVEQRQLFTNLFPTDNKNNHIVISLSDFGKYGELLSKKNIPVYALNFRRNRFNFFKIFKLLNKIEKFNPEIIQSWMYHADFLTSIIKLFYPKKKIVWGIRNTTYKFQDSISRYFISKICSFLSNFIPNLIISCSDRARDDHMRFGYNKKIIKVIYNGVDLNKFKIKNIDNLNIKKFNFLKLDKKKPRIGMVARYDKQKGHKIFLDSLFKLKERKIDFNCYLVGKNMDLNNKELISIIEEFNLTSNVFLLGQLSDVSLIYNFLDISVLSSINGEGFPNVLIESMACGTPCVATDTGDEKHIIQNTGWIAKASDSLSLANELDKAIAEINLPNWSNRK